MPSEYITKIKKISNLISYLLYNYGGKDKIFIQTSKFFGT